MNDSDTSTTKGLATMNGWWAASGLFILLVVVGLVSVLIWGGSPDSEPGAGPSQPPATQSVVKPPGDSQRPLTASPATRWQGLHGLELPVSTTEGPAHRDGNLWSGYSHTPTGALFAAAYLAAATDGPEAEQVMRRQAVPGTAAAAYTRQVAATPKAVQPGTSAAVAGFRFISYSPPAAKVELLLTSADFTASVAVDVQWLDGDWKIDFEPAGGQPEVVRVAGTSGFIPWSAS